MNPVSARLLSQQLSAPQFKEAAEVVSWFGAMQAQEPRSMRHLLRCIWQLVAAEAYRLFLACGEVMFKTGAAIDLCRLGYKLEKVNLT